MRLWLLLVLVIFAAGCSAGEPATKPVPADPPPANVAPDPAPKQPPTAPAPPPSTGIPSSPATATKAHVKRVVDGDTVELADGTKVRLIGVNTPESVDPRRPVEHYGKEASDYTKKRLTGKDVLLDYDVERYDKYRRTLAYLWLTNGAFFNAELIRQGYAQTLTIPPNVRYAELFRRLEREAREARRGLWSDPAPPTSPQPKTPALRYDPAGPDRDCSDFVTQAEAQAFFEAAGGPARDPHRLDRDRDGVACESLR